jgi:hypothetical protein
MFGVDCPTLPDTGEVVGIGEESGDAVVWSGPVDPEGVVVHPKIITKETNRRNTQKVLIENIDEDMVLHLVL